MSSYAGAQTGLWRRTRDLLQVLGYPLILLPDGGISADTDRHSGFLSGREGESGLRGFQYLQPYYFAINKSSDATAAFDVETSQRVGLLGEYRLTNGLDDYFWVNAAYHNEVDLLQLQSPERYCRQTRLPIIISRSIASIVGMMRQHLNLLDLTLSRQHGNTTSDSLYLR